MRKTPTKPGLKAVKPKAPVTLSDELASSLAPTQERIAALEIAITRQQVAVLQQQNALLQMTAERDKLNAYQQGVIEQVARQGGLPPEMARLAGDGKTIITE